MSWKPTPPWADARTLRWVAEQIEQDRAAQAKTARVYADVEYIGGRASGSAMWLGIVANKLKNRATRQEKRQRSKRGG